MIPTVIAALVTEVLRLINNIMEGTPIEQRRATAIGWYQLTLPISRKLLPKDTMDAIEAVMVNVKP